MTDDKIAQALNMRPLEEVEAEKQEALDRLNPEKLPELPINSFSTNEDVELVQESVDDVKNLPQESVMQPPAVISKEAEENLKDIELAKANIENIINLGDDSVKEMVEIAKQSESPRAFEVVSTLMKTLLDANKDYVEMSTKKRYAKEEDTSNQAQITNNNLIVSTADLLKMIKGDNENG
tara:strand:+ start:1455 stop:1994 length:540 start_codon:yes stop_codon:yes gene_type:complete